MTHARTDATFVSPIVETKHWLSTIPVPEAYPLLNVSQAAPAEAPPRPLREAMADALLTQTEAHLYGPVLGNPDLRDALAQQMNVHYGADLSSGNIAITSGCNQAFAAAISCLCGEGDEVILPTPWYFNHKMWLDMQGVETVPLPAGAEMLPDPDAAAGLLTPRTKAIVLVTPNNPTGVEYPSELLERFCALARANNIALIVDETYRDFDSRDGTPHRLFDHADWADTLIHLYSFSKAYRLTGHRIGAVAASPARLNAMEKFLDTVTICPSQIGQIGARWGIENLSQWLAGERAEILERRNAIESAFAPLAARGWRLMGRGAYFAYVAHPYAESSESIARSLLANVGVLMLPGTMFRPEGSDEGQQEFRIAFANVDTNGIAELVERLCAFHDQQSQ